MANVTRGLIQVEPAALELMRSYAASEWTVLRKVRIPNALPYFFTALKLATTLSLIGAIVGEYFGGASVVLGRIIVQSASALRFDITWAAIVARRRSTGIVFYLVDRRASSGSSSRGTRSRARPSRPVDRTDRPDAHASFARASGSFRDRGCVPQEERATRGTTEEEQA